VTIAANSNSAISPSTMSRRGERDLAGILATFGVCHAGPVSPGKEAVVAGDLPTDLLWSPDETGDGDPISDRPDETLADRYLRLSCLTYATDSPVRRAGARALLAGHPELRADLAVAAAAGDLTAVTQGLNDDPGDARRPTGPYRWSPLLYLTYARAQPPDSQAVACAERLLEAGADPNDGRLWHGLPTPFTALTGVFGSGTDEQPAHPDATRLARVLLEAGADPNDGQALYNRMFGADDDHLELLLEFGLGRGDGGPWHRRPGARVDPPVTMIRSLLAWAITHDQRDRVRLLARHGVDLRAPLSGGLPSVTVERRPIEVAVLNGHRDLVDELTALGAGAPELSATDRVIAAALAEDTDAFRSSSPAAVTAARQERPGLVVWATALGRPHAVRLLVEAGWDVNQLGRGDTTIEQLWESPLHVAAGDGHLGLVGLLLDLGADPTVRDHRFQGTPREWAEHFGHTEAAARLAAVEP
jgi:hypothetical protein